MSDHNQLGAVKLASSGLDSEDANLLGITFLSAQETSLQHHSFRPFCSMKLPYLGLDGQPLPDREGSTPFYRIRYLEAGTGFDSLTSKKIQRYTQEPDTAPVAYYPGNQDWSEIAEDVEAPIIITEGELKAAKACKEGFPTIGLGGVYNWRSRKMGVEWLPSLQLVKWVKRHVYICFDSDYRTNPAVCTALRELGEELHRQGCFVYVVSLPELPGLDKVGLDDFLVHAGPSSSDMFRALLSEAEPMGLTAPLFGLNERYVYVRNPGCIINQKNLVKTSPSAFKEHLESTLNYHERSLKKDGTLSYKIVCAASAWLKWPLRTEVEGLAYTPGSEKFVSDDEGLTFNTWPGWGVAPVAGDHTPFLQLIDHLFTGAEEDAKQWFLRWCAYPLQYPGTKLFSSAVIHGIRHGTGKSLIGFTLGAIYGKNFTEISKIDLHKQHNAWAECVQFAMGDDVTGSNKRDDADFLKKLITQKKMRIDPKFINSYEIKDCINYYFTANHPDSFFLEDDDRRYFIHEVQCTPLSKEFYKHYDNWMKSGGPSAVFHYLLNLDLGDFYPTGHAFRTAAKDRMITNVQSDLAGWVRSLIATPDYVLKVGNIVVTKDLFTSKELLQFYDPTGRTGTTANGLGRELSRAGVRQVNNGKPVKLPDGSQGRYYIIRNVELWVDAQTQSIVQHLVDWDKSELFDNTRKY